MPRVSGTIAGLVSKARSLRGCVAPHPCGRGLPVALLTLGLCLPCTPGLAKNAQAPLSSQNKEEKRVLAGGQYTNTISPATTPTLSSELPPFSAFATASLPFGGLIHQDSVFSVARSAAYLQALREVALNLQKHTVAHIGAHELTRRMALAMAPYNPTVSKSVTSLPDSHDELLTVMLRLAAPSEIVDRRLRQTIQHPDTWDLYAAVLQQLQTLVQEGSELITRAAALRKDHGVHMDEAFMNRSTHIADQLDALWMYLQILPDLRSLWETPTLVQKQMQHALTLAPQQPLLWCALGEAQLQLDLPQKALGSLNEALKFAPDLARALYARGVAHLRLQQSALAENDLTAALNLQPDTVHWLRARGAVRMVREDYGPMCEDFLAACALGDCDGLITARKRDLCLPAPEAKSDSASPKVPATTEVAKPPLP